MEYVQTMTRHPQPRLGRDFLMKSLPMLHTHFVLHEGLSLAIRPRVGLQTNKDRGGCTNHWTYGSVHP